MANPIGGEMVKTIREVLETRRQQFIGWMIASASFFLLASIVGGNRAEWYSERENLFLTIVMFVLFVLALLAGFISYMYGKEYEKVRRAIVGRKGTQR